MSTPLAINGTNYSPISDAFAVVSTPAAAIYYAQMPYGQQPMEGALSYEELLGSFPGVNGMFTKRFGGRMRIIIARMMIVGADESACETLKNAMLASVSGLDRYSVTVPGGTARTGCKLLQPSGFSPEFFEYYPGAIGLYGVLNLIDLSGAA